MKLLIVTCPKTAHILPMQNYLFKRFRWDFDVHHIHNNKSRESWCKSVYNELCYIEDEIIMFGLDDFLPIQQPNKHRLLEAEQILDNYDRVELNWGGSKHKNKVKCTMYITPSHPFNESVDHWRYTDQHPYTVSCQFSLWKKESLKKVLQEVDSNPWNFEKKGRCNAACLEAPALRYIEESALSNRRPRMINLLGMPVKVINELIEKGYVRESQIIYGWKGAKKLTPDLYGNKYKEFYT